MKRCFPLSGKPQLQYNWKHSMIWGCNTFQTPVATLLSVGHQQSPFSVLILDPMAYFLSIGTWCFFFFLHHLGFSLMSMVEIEQGRLNCSSPLTVHINHVCLIIDLFYATLFAFLIASWSLVPLQHRFSIAMIAMTHKRDGYLALAIQPFCMSLIPWQLPAPTSSSNVLQGSM